MPPDSSRNNTKVGHELLNSRPVEAINALEKLFNDRDLRLNELLSGLAVRPLNSVVGAWAYLKKAEWAHTNISNDELKEVASYVYGYKDDLKVRARLELLLLSVIVRQGTCEHLDSFWRNAHYTKEIIPFNRKIDILRKLRSTPSCKTEARHMQQLIEKNATPFELLKLKNADFLEGKFIKEWSHEDAECAFVETAPSPIAEEFATSVRLHYDALRNRMRFMEVRTNKTQAEELSMRIKKALKNKTPFSIVRLSDGEGYLFPEGSFCKEEDFANRERHWWGTELSQKIREGIVLAAREAVAQADVVGVPTVYRMIRDHHSNSTSLLHSIQGRCLLQVLGCLPNLASASSVFTEDKVNVALFRSAETIEPLVAEATRVFVVASITAEYLPPALMCSGKVKIINIPTHHKTTLNEKYHRGPKALPFMYRSVLEQLDDEVRPGDLVLVAGGIIGKIFVGRVRANGGVALDIGHTLDDWVSQQLPSLK